MASPILAYQTYKKLIAEAVREITYTEDLTDFKAALDVAIRNSDGSAIDGGNPLPVAGAFSGSVTAQNPPPNGFKVTTMQVTDVPTKLPAVPAANRVGLDVRNLDPVEPIFIGPDSSVSSVQAIGTTYGRQIGADEGDNFELAPTLEPYAVAEAGETVLVQVTEWTYTP